MEIGEKENCLSELKRFNELAKQIKAVAKQNDFNIAVRNPIYFSAISEEILEEYLPEVFPEKALSQYDAFFGNDGNYAEFRKMVTESQ